MKQLLLRVPDDLHRKLALRAAREHRSVNAIANEALQVAASVDSGSRQDRVRVRAVALGWAPTYAKRPTPGSTHSEAEAAVAAMDGLGPVIDRILDDVRHR